jgi:hypothetical protein
MKSHPNQGLADGQALDGDREGRQPGLGLGRAEQADAGQARTFEER